ncbi:MAG: DUF3298 domain-containing protein [Verrucomicrobiaceae bacterium]|nr:DUF3298 domain-containing protein [Verrucomicrobiaceae bacterium]
MTRFYFALSALVCFFTGSALATEKNAPIQHFQGTIGKDLKVSLTLWTNQTEEGEQLRGSYHYQKSGIPISLDIGKDPKNEDQLIFIESTGWSMDGDQQVTGRWTVVWKSSTITGTWKTPDGKKSLPVNLELSQPEGSVSLDQIHLTYEVKETDQVAPRGYQRELTLLTAPENEALSRKLLELACESYKDDENRVPANFNELKQAMRASTHEEIDAEATYVDTYSEHFSVRMNESGFLTLENSNYGYSGGAHGHYGSQFAVLDTATMTVLKLTDIVSPEKIASWKSLAISALKKSRAVPQDAPLSETGVTVEDYTPTPEDSWFLVPGGIGFYYEPYAIGSYAAGEYEFILPWKEIVRDLKPGTAVHKLAQKMTGGS